MRAKSGQNSNTLRQHCKRENTEPSRISWTDKRTPLRGSPKVISEGLAFSDKGQEPMALQSKTRRFGTLSDQLCLQGHTPKEQRWADRCLLLCINETCMVIMTSAFSDVKWAPTTVFRVCG